MLLSIRKRAPGDADEAAERGLDSPVDMLLACHARIRAFARIAEALARAPLTTPPNEIAEAARGLERYHRIALPLHEADEDRSLRPRLPALASVMDRIEQEHHRIDALVAELLPLWIEIASTPARFPELAPRLQDPTAALLALWDPHLDLEEEQMIPAARALAPDVQRALADEMRARRGVAG